MARGKNAQKKTLRHIEGKDFWIMDDKKEHRDKVSSFLLERGAIVRSFKHTDDIMRAIDGGEKLPDMIISDYSIGGNSPTVLTKLRETDIPDAGEQLIKFMALKKLRTPVLIYTGDDALTNDSFRSFGVPVRVMTKGNSSNHKLLETTINSLAELAAVRSKN